MRKEEIDELQREVQKNLGEKWEVKPMSVKKIGGDKEAIGCRFQGDEFMVVLLNTKEEEITDLCEKADECLKERGKELEIAFPISTSYGFATRRRGSNEDLNDIVNKADERMYDYKESH